jgi:uncharacterized protein YndB with AHSA1/START domain
MTRRIKGKRDDVFAAWTDPKIFKRWWGPPGTTTTAAEIDARVGGAYRVTMRLPGGEVVYLNGKFLEVERPTKLVYTWAWEEDEGIGPESRVTVAFASADGETDVTVIHEQLPNEESRDRHSHGWIGCLDNLTEMFRREDA